MADPKKIALIGAGNMGEALLAGFLSAGIVKPSAVAVCEVRPDAARQLRKRFRVAVSADLPQTAKGATTVILAVKPQQMAGVLAPLKTALAPKALVISIAAGLTTDFFEGRLPPRTPVVRAMPNTPALVAEGAIGLAAGRFAKPSHLAQAERMLRAVGQTVRVPESAMDAVTAVSGSGPAYVFYLAEVLQSAALDLGLPAPVGDALVRQTILGAGKLLVGSQDSAEELRRKVTSPGGTTEAAFSVLQQGGLHSLFQQALRCAAERSRALSKEAERA